MHLPLVNANSEIVVLQGRRSDTGAGTARPAMLRIIQALYAGSASVEEAIERVWGSEKNGRG